MKTIKHIAMVAALCTASVGMASTTHAAGAGFSAIGLSKALEQGLGTTPLLIEVQARGNGEGRRAKGNGDRKRRAKGDGKRNKSANNSKKQKQASQPKANKKAKAKKPSPPVKTANKRKKNSTLNKVKRFAKQVLRNEFFNDYVPGFDRPRRNRRHAYADFGCRAVAFTRRGRPLNIRGYAEGPRACRKAMRKCNRKLRIRQDNGRNPFARCMID